MNTTTENTEADSRDRGRLVTVFGGTGFLGRRIVRHLLDRGFAVRAASRHPDRVQSLFKSEGPVPQAVAADAHDDASLASALAGAYGAVNAISLYVEHGRETFHAVHIDAAVRIAGCAREAGVERLVHVSGIGADASSSSPYIRARGRGELAVTTAFAGAIVVRPAVMFGPDDVFLTSLAKLVRTVPLYPLFGSGQTRLQPVHVDDVAEGIARVLDGSGGVSSACYEFGGPRCYTYKELVQSISDAMHVRTRMVPMPFALWQAVALAAEFLPGTPLTRNQIDLMQHDNIASRDLPGLPDLHVIPTSVEYILAEMRAKHGVFDHEQRPTKG